MSFFSKNPFWGIDIGSDAIKGVCLTRTRSGFRLKNAAIVERSIVERSDEKTALTEEISELLGKSRPKVHAAVHFSGRVSPEVRRLTLPVMPKKELREAIRWEARKLTPLPEDEIVVDFFIMGKHEAERGEQHEILVVIVERAALEEQLTQIKMAGLTVSAVDVSAIALLNTARLHFLAEMPNSLLYVNIGAQRMEINIVKNGVIRFTRQLTLGGKTMTASLSEKLGLTLAEAEQYKRKKGIPSEALARTAILKQIDRMIVEIQRSVDYYRAQSRESGIDKILLMGGLPLLPGFLPYFSDFFDAPVEIESALSDLEIQNPDLAILQTMAPQFSLALGLAMRKQ